MSYAQISEYISQARAKSLSTEMIRENLLKVGWNIRDVDSALGSTSDGLVVPLPIPTATPTPALTPNNMWDSFQHILLFISLYVMATSIALMIHQLIDKYVPGVTIPYAPYMNDYQNMLLQGEAAALIVSFPLYAFFFLSIAKRTIMYPVIRQLKSRKRLIYLTLIITFIIVLINVVSIVFNFLRGNVTANSILHFLNTVTISGIVFAYYLFQVREDRRVNE